MDMTEENIFHLGGVSTGKEVTLLVLRVGFSLPGGRHPAQSALGVLHILLTCYRNQDLWDHSLWGSKRP